MVAARISATHRPLGLCCGSDSTWKCTVGCNNPGPVRSLVLLTEGTTRERLRREVRDGHEVLVLVVVHRRGLFDGRMILTRLADVVFVFIDHLDGVVFVQRVTVR